MPVSAAKFRAAYAEYLARERAAASKHEYYDGAIYAMAGGTIEHGLLATNAIRLLATTLLDRPCIVLNSDVRVRVLDTGLSTYPDVSVVCGPVARAADDPDAVTNPGVIVEVLSDSTEAYDPIEKFAHYRRVPTLREYVLISQRERRVEVYQRAEQRRWTLEEAAGGRIAVPSLGLELAVDDVYRGVELREK